MGEARARVHPIVNPEHCAAALRRLVRAWDDDGGGYDEFLAALREARQLLGIAIPGEKGDA